jgi:hypothetical protein
VVNLDSMLSGEVGGIVVDPAGAVIPRALVSVVNPETGNTKNTVTNSAGYWVVSGMTSGKLKVTVSAQGFNTSVRDITYDVSRPAKLATRLAVAAANEVVEVQSQSSYVNTLQQFDKIAREVKKNEEVQQNAASSNVFSLQKRVAGVLPVRVDVPRAGNSYRFVRPLVLDEETRVTFSYKTKDSKNRVIAP